MLIRTDTLTPWEGERLSDGVLYPKNIEKLWSVEELAAIGLVPMVPFVVPDGHMIIGEATYDATGQQTYPTEPIPPPTPEEIAADKAEAMDGVFRSWATTKLLFYLGQAQGLFNSLEEMRAWVDAKEDPPETAPGGGGKP